MPVLPCAGGLAERHGAAVVWHVAWAGAAAAGQALEVPAALARRQGLAEGMLVSVRALPDTPAAQSVCVEPDSTDDWEQLELNAGYVEEQLLNQARRLHGLRLAGWQQGLSCCAWLCGTSRGPSVEHAPKGSFAFIVPQVMQTRSLVFIC